MMVAQGHERPQAGFTYIGVLLFVAIGGVLLAWVGQSWHMLVAREKEEALLFIGHEYRNAIRRYHAGTTSGVQRYPRQLTDLIKDPRSPDTRRYLRRLYRDPITGGEEWGLVKSADGGIAGVYSMSDAAPIKQKNFRVEDAAFEDREKYSDWQFVYAPQAAQGAPAPAPAPVAPAK